MADTPSLTDLERTKINMDAFNAAMESDDPDATYEMANGSHAKSRASIEAVAAEQVATATAQAGIATTQAGIASAAAENAQASARTVSLWTTLATYTPSVIGEGATILDSDTGTHTDPQTSATVANAGEYTAYATTVGAWTRIGDTGLAGKASASDLAGETASRIAGDNAERAAREAIVQPTGTPGFAWTVKDDHGNDAIGVKDDGTFKADATDFAVLNGFLAAAVALAINAIRGEVPDGYAWAITDDDDDAAIGVKSDGTFAADTAEVSVLNGVPVDDLVSPYLLDPLDTGFQADIVHLVSYGQSNSIGVMTSAITTAQAYDSLKLNGTLNGFVDLVEPCSTKGVGETPCSGAADQIKQLILSENGLAYTDQSYRLLMSAEGVSGAPIATLRSGTANYASMIATIQAGYDTAQAAGKSYAMPAFFWTQGEADQSTAFDTYVSEMRTLRRDFEASVQGIIGRAERVAMFTYQVATHKTSGVAYPSAALAHLDVAKNDKNIYLATPTYHLGYNTTDNVHFMAASGKKLGAHYGLAFKRVVIDRLDWKPLMPIAKYRQGKVAVVKFHVPRGRLVFDTTLVAANTNMGFNLFDASDNEITISSVTIIGPDCVRIVAASTISAGAKLRYAFYGSGLAGPAVGPRGNLRDTQGDIIVFTAPGITYPVHNWCVIFEEIF